MYHTFVDDFDQSTNLPEFNLESSSISTSKQQCQVCTLEAHGMHFGVMACRPCAAFFRRIVVLGLQYTCIQNSSKCNVTGRGRNVCRDCRYKKCLAVGMTTDNVQYNRDCAKKIKKEKKTRKIVGKMEARSSQSYYSDENPQSEDSTSAAEDYPSRELNDEQIDEIIQDIRNLFIEYIPPKLEYISARNQLERMTNALLFYRQNQRPAEHLTFVEKINFSTDSELYYTKRCQKFSKWARCIDFFDQIPEEDKLWIVKGSFTIFNSLERCQMTSRVFGESILTEQKYIFSSYCACNMETVIIETATAAQTEQADNYIRTAFYEHVKANFDEIIRPLFGLALSDVETAFMLSQCIMYNIEKLPVHLNRKFEDLRESVSNNLHDYYNEHKIVNYADRMTRIMNIVRSIKRIYMERQRKIDMIRLFDIYKVSDKKHDLYCT